MRRIKNHRWESFTTETPGNGTLIADFEHQDSSGNSLYDRVGNKLIEYKTHGAENSEMYQYDSAYRLTSTGAGAQSAGSRAFERGTFSDGDRDSMSTVNYYEDWDLDGVGNWPSVWKNSSTAQTRTHSDYNEIVNNNGTSLSFDKNGNLTDDGTNTYGWDPFGRLGFVMRKSDSQYLITCVYDADNRRISKWDWVGSEGKFYYYSGWRALEECTYYYDEANLQRLERQYVWGGTYLDEIWTQDDRWTGSATISVSSLNDGSGTQRLFHCSNTLYSVFAVTDETGAFQERYQYAPYGGRTIYDSSSNVLSSSAYSIDYAFTGQRYDPEIEMMYCKYRYQYPELGRFISRDPIGYYGGLNLYAYVDDNPTLYIDPMGQAAVSLNGGNANSSDDKKWEKDVGSALDKCKTEQPCRDPAKPNTPAKGNSCHSFACCVMKKLYGSDLGNVPPGISSEPYDSNQKPPSGSLVCYGSGRKRVPCSPSDVCNKTEGKGDSDHIHTGVIGPGNEFWECGARDVDDNGDPKPGTGVHTYPTIPGRPESDPDPKLPSMYWPGFPPGKTFSDMHGMI